MGKPGVFTREKKAIARRALEKGATVVEAADAAGVSNATITLAMRQGILPRTQKALDRERAIAQNRKYRHEFPREMPQRVAISQKADIERNARAAAADNRTFTACFFGDPAPGYSALDGKTGQT